MTINYFLLLDSNENIIGPGDQSATQTETVATTDPTTGKITTSTVQTPLPLPPGCIACTQTQAETWQTLEYVAGILQDIPAAAQLQAAQTSQRALVKQSFTAAANANVTDSAGNVWEGSMASGNSIFLACQLAQHAGATSITLYDAAKNPHSMTIAEGMDVAALIGQAYQVALGTKNSLNAQIAAAQTVSAVQAVTWS